MQDSWRSNHGYEAMLDFQMSWLMRLAAEKNIKKGIERLHKISQEVLLRLIEMDGAKDVKIENVEVWRQWEKIDVTAEVEINNNGMTEHHLIVLEDKAYTMIHDNQLERYSETVNAYYSGRHKKQYKIHFWVITFYDAESKYWDILKCECGKYKWNLLSFYDVIGWKEGEFEDTESDLFNEFWLREWY